MVPSIASALRKFAGLLVKLLKSSFHRGQFVLQSLHFLLRRLGRCRVYFYHSTYPTQEPHKGLRDVAIRTSIFPVVQPSPLATDDYNPSEQREVHASTTKTNISFSEHPLHTNPAHFIAVGIGAGGDIEALNPSDGQYPDSAEKSEPHHGSGLGIPIGFPEPSIRTPDQMQEVQPQITGVQNLPPDETKPIIPTDVKRYERGIKMKWVEPKPIVIKPQDDTTFMELVQDGWCDFVHPEGPRVYYHPEKRIFTDADLRPGKIDSQALLDKVDALKAYAINFPGVSARMNMETETVLEVDVGRNNTIESYGYYFVSHSTRTIFWAHEYTCEPDGEVLFNVKSARKRSHIRYSLEAQYWPVLFYWIGTYHCELYPHNKYIPRPVFEELKEIIIHADAEAITSDTSLAPYDGDELAKMLDLMDRVEGSVDKLHPHSICVIARFMREFAQVKFMNFCGQPGARVDADKSVYSKRGHDRETLIFRLSNLFLWYAPQRHHKRIQRVWVDEIINAPRWKNFIALQNSEWMGFTLYSTVMLAVDISFLAVPGVINDGSPSQTAPNLAIYMSTLCSVSSLVVSVVLVGQSQDNNLQTAEGGADYMSLMTSEVTGFEGLALMHSLPFALLIWAMTFFGLALSIFIFTTGSVATLATMIPGWVIVVIFTLWPITIRSTGWLLDLVVTLVDQPKQAIRYVIGSGRSEQESEAEGV